MCSFGNPEIDKEVLAPKLKSDYLVMRPSPNKKINQLVP